MKTILLLTIVCAASAQAQYSSAWSAFDSGSATHHGGATTHAGIFSAWHSEPLESTDYESQQFYPTLPLAVQIPGLPALTITRVGDHVRVAWPASATSFTLQETSALDPSGAASIDSNLSASSSTSISTSISASISASGWQGIPGPYPQTGEERYIIVPASEAARFFRLMAP